MFCYMVCWGKFFVFYQFDVDFVEEVVVVGYICFIVVVFIGDYWEYRFGIYLFYVFLVIGFEWLFDEFYVQFFQVGCIGNGLFSSLGGIGINVEYSICFSLQSFNNFKVMVGVQFNFVKWLGLFSYFCSYFFYVCYVDGIVGMGCSGLFYFLKFVYWSVVYFVK